MAEILPANMHGYAEAAKLLRAGELVILPTDTVYGLAARADDLKAIAEIYKVKQRPQAKALSVVVFAPQHAKKLVHISPLAQSLMDRFWPGALTLVLPARQDVPTLAVRCPDIGWTQAFTKLGFTAPLVLPSANTSGLAAPTTAAGAQADIGDKVPLILDGGPCAGGRESTIVALEQGRIKVLRTGVIAPEEFAEFGLVLPL
ncbi:MAG: threonylcarbamoyl-AMP synthase [Robiginitomaculum sp.]|nr:MAG: threonylcarbamoyl-AMP synthase [Robiginitomaculum sp.]